MPSTPLPEIARRPHLVERLARHPHQYFRFTNREFAARICRRFAEEMATFPIVNLHGDAHVEQFAVWDAGEGLVDYDDATAGPAPIDLMRFGTSLRIVASTNGLDAKRAFDAFLSAYRAALTRPETRAPTTAFAERARAAFSSDREAFFRRVEGLTAPLSGAERAAFDDLWQRYTAMVTEAKPNLSPAFFRTKTVGQLVRGGVGSALDQRILSRIEGPTESIDDDVVIELKELRDLKGVECVRVDLGGGRFRTIIGQARLGQTVDPLLAVVPPREAGGKVFWAQSWRSNYQELAMDHDLRDQADLDEVAAFVGTQLGRGHVLHIASPFDAQLRQALLDMLNAHEVRLRQSVVELADLTERSWRWFRTEIEKQTPTRKAGRAQVAPPQKRGNMAR
ncbi:MAG: DUF2252 family protein [Myxococcota bacterium]